MNGLKALATTVVIFFGCAGLIWAGMMLAPPEIPLRPPPPVVDFKRLDEIDSRVRALEGLRCVTIKAEKFDLTIYPVTSLGKAKP